VEGVRIVLEVAAGTTVLDAALGHGVVISTLCGGAMQCKTCRVQIADETSPSAISPRGKKEESVRLALGLDDKSRLACQVKVLADAVVLLPPPVSEDARDVEGELPDDELTLED